MYKAQQEAMARSAALEGDCFEGRITPLLAPTLAAPKPKKAKRGKNSGGFGGKAKPAAETKAEAAAEAAAAARWRVLQKEGILKIEGACSAATAADLREYVIADLAAAREACAAAEDPVHENMRHFHSAASEQPLRSFLLTPLDDARCHAGLRELLGPGRALGDIFSKACGGDDADFYDYNALRTEPGSPRQPVHWDTPFQETPPLYTAFVALQRVTREMGATLFLPRTHTLTKERRRFDAGLTDGRRNDMLGAAKCQDGILEAGDVTIFDMRLLHCGQPNLEGLGDQRFFLNFTFRNPRAECWDLGHLPCIRPGYKMKMTLGDVRAELASAEPFSAYGDGFGSDVVFGL